MFKPISIRLDFTARRILKNEQEKNMYAISSEKNEDEIVRVHSYKNAHSVQIMWFIP